MNLPDEYYAQGYGAGYEAYTQVWFFIEQKMYLPIFYHKRFKMVMIGQQHQMNVALQTQRLEQCMYPGAPCSFIDPHFNSGCLQKHNFVRLLAYTYEEGLHIDSFKLPVSCSCHLSPPPPHYSPYQPAFSPAPPHHPPPPPPYHHQG